jgi:hypothetical protein
VGDGQGSHSSTFDRRWSRWDWRVSNTFQYGQALTGLYPVNIGLLAGGSYAFYTQPKLRHDTKIITSAIVATFALFGAESYVARTCPRPLKENTAYRRGEGDRATSFACHPAHEPEPMRMSRVFEGSTGIGKSILCTSEFHVNVLHSQRRRLEHRRFSHVQILG